MIRGMYSVRDSEGEIYGSPVTEMTAASAVRAFTAEVLREGSVMGQFPEHFSLVRVGSFNVQTGSLIPLGADELVITAVDVCRRHGRARGEALPGGAEGASGDGEPYPQLELEDAETAESS